MAKQKTLDELRAEAHKKVLENIEKNKGKKPNYSNEEDTSCGMLPEQVPIVNRDEAKKMYDKLHLSYEYTGRTNDGTNRKIWTLVDPNKEIVGKMKTSKNRMINPRPKGPWDEQFSYMSLFHYYDHIPNKEVNFLPSTTYYMKERENTPLNKEMKKRVEAGEKLPESFEEMFKLKKEIEDSGLE
tara:strand:+ start:364 stop:915 length:552 start_codon:yes stop_codon:yes gene_type:complete